MLEDVLGYGVIQEFPGSRNDATARVVFALHGDRIVDEAAGALRRLDTPALMRRPSNQQGS
ncbi:MAG: hypothetical protein WEF86_02745 [Gemmatimonadota bacterium]